jgi:16S rRNA (cytosine1402-N4)-methyltransferase
MMMAPVVTEPGLHVPVLLAPLLAAVAPVRGVWVDGTFGAGGYARGLLDAGAARVIGIDRDPEALAGAAAWAGEAGDRLSVVDGTFGRLDAIAAGEGAPALDGVVLDVGVSSMQLDRAERGFSFQKDGPLDMRMSRAGLSAADLVNRLPEAALADILFQYGEERASRRIARAIVAARKARPFTTTLELAAVIERQLPRPKPGQPHAATRSFQALRIAVNDELGELVRGLAAAEAALAPGGWLAVVTFHSLEDRIVKRFLQLRSGAAPRESRHAPEAAPQAPRFALATRKAVVADEGELAANPRARSAKLRVARRLDAPAGKVDPRALGVPRLVAEGDG